MLAILGNLKLIMAGAAAVAMLGVGYAFGARKVDALEAEIEELKIKGDSAEERRKKTQEEIDKALKAAGAEHTRQMELLKVEGERKAKELDAALAGKDSRIADLQARMSVNKAQQSKLTADLAKTVSPAEKKALQDQIDALRRETTVLTAKVDANQCLALAVPEVVIGSLVK